MALLFLGSLGLAHQSERGAPWHCLGTGKSLGKPDQRCALESGAGTSSLSFFAVCHLQVQQRPGATFGLG